MKISIIIPVKNGALFIKNTLNSILQQNYKNFNVIIVDGGSTDNTIQIINEFTNNNPIHFNLIIHNDDKNSTGPGKAWSKGLEIADGDIMGWLGADDLYFDSTVFDTIINYFKGNPCVNLVHGNCTIIDFRGDFKKNIISRKINLKDLLHNGNWVPFTSTFYLSSLVDKIGRKTDFYGNDLDFLIRAAKVTDFNYIDNTLSKFRVHDDSNTGNRRKLVRARFEDCKTVLRHGASINNFYTRRLFIDIIRYLIKI